MEFDDTTTCNSTWSYWLNWGVFCFFVVLLLPSRFIPVSWRSSLRAFFVSVHVPGGMLNNNRPSNSQNRLDQVQYSNSYRWVSFMRFPTACQRPWDLNICTPMSSMTVVNSFVAMLYSTHPWGDTPTSSMNLFLVINWLLRSSSS